MKVALLSCTSKKKFYKCRASEMYSESPRFALAYEYAKMKSDVVYILSAKYGLISEDMEIEPYNETLKDKSTYERKEWAQNVLNKLNNLFSLQNDEFLVLAGVAYNEYLLPHFNKYELPLKGQSLGNWIPKLRELIDAYTIKDNTSCDEIHIIFNNIPRMRWSDINNLPFNNGIYIIFENGERYSNMDRIVRVGTHREDERLRKRLKDHFIRENKDGSIFRKNIGRAMLHLKTDPYETIWDLDTSKPEVKEKYVNLLNPEYKREIEKLVTSYMQENFSFVCFEVNSKQERLRLEEGLIASLNQSIPCKSTNDWLGLHSPVECIAKSGLWNSQGLNGKPLTVEEIDRIKKLIKKDNTNQINFENVMKPKILSERSFQQKSTINQNNVPTNQIRNYIEAKLKSAKESGLEYIHKIKKLIKKDNNNQTNFENFDMPEELSERILQQKSTTKNNSSTNQIRSYIEVKLQNAKQNGLEYIDIISGDIHREMNLNSRMPSVCSAMNQLKTGTDIVLNTTPSGLSSTIKIRYYLKNM